MKNGKTLLLSALCAVLFASVSLAQTPKQIPKAKEFISKPQLASQKIITEEMYNTFITGKYQSESAGSYWDAYSDRSSNNTYVDSKCKKTFSSLGYKEKVRIAAIRGNAALVYSIPEGLVYPALPSTFEWKGWIPLSNLLLTDYALSDAKGQFSKVVISQDALELQMDAAAFEGRLYTTPLNPTNYAPLPGETTTSIFYVAKKDGSSMFLLAHDPDLTNPDNIYGWVTASSLQITNNGRLFLEPTWEQGNVVTFATAGTSVDVKGFGGKSLGTIRFEMPSGDGYDDNAGRLSGGQWRFPLIGSFGSSNIFAFPASSAFGTKGPEAKADMSEDLNNVNIMLVMDGSKAYEPYLTAIIDRIKQLRNINKYASIKVGYVFYRDATTEEYATEIFPLSDVKFRSLVDYLDKGGEFGFKGNFVEPLLCAGIETAIENAGFHASESNYMIVLGGMGDLNDSKSAVPANIGEKLDSQNINLLGVQLQNYPTRYPFRLFNSQITEMMSTRLKSRLEKTESDEVSVMQSTKVNGNVSEVDFYKDAVDNPLFDYHTYVPSRMMDEGDFEDVLKEMFNRIFENVDMQLSGKGTTVVEEKAETFYYATSLRADVGKREFFKSVAMYDMYEFDDLMAKFADFYDMALTKKDKPDEFVDRLSNWVEATVPVGSIPKIEEIGFYEALRIVEGIDYTQDYDKGKKFKDIRSFKGCTQEEFADMMEDFSLKYRMLLEIQKTPYKYTSTANGKTVYWVPVERLP